MADSNLTELLPQVPTPTPPILRISPKPLAAERIDSNKNRRPARGDKEKGAQMRNDFKVALVVVLLAAAAVTPVAHAQYTLTEFVVPDAASTTLFDVNNSGTLVGYSISPSGYASGFIYEGDTLTPLEGPVGSISSHAVGISDDGVVVGNYSTGFEVSLGFIYVGGSYASFSVAGADGTWLRGISPDGRYISGYYYSSAFGTYPGFVYDIVAGSLAQVSRPDSLQTIPQGINSNGLMVGSDTVLLGTFSYDRPGFTYDIATATRTDLSIAGAFKTAFRSIDDAGTLAGWFIDADRRVHGFVGSVASFEQIDFPGADETYVEGSNNAGVLVGGFLAGEVYGAFVATPATVFSLLEDLADDVAGIGPGKSLADKVAAVQAYLEASDEVAACAMLAGLQEHVIAQSGKKIDGETASQLVADAQELMDAIPCQ